MSELPKLVILVSGSGSNLQAIMDASAAGDLEASIGLVISNRPGVKALQRAEQAHIPQLCIPHQDYPDRESFEAALIGSIDTIQPKAVILAGFDRLLSPTFIRHYPQQIINIHPALLPAFPGMHGVKQALDYGAKVTGVTVHFVDEGMDTGPIILQTSLPIEEQATEAQLLERVHALEHRIFPAAIQLMVTGRLQIDGRRVHIL